MKKLALPRPGLRPKQRGIKGVSAETLRKLCDGLGLSADYLLCGKEAFADISPIVAMLATLDEAYIPLAEDVLKAFFFAIALKEGKAR